ncbi:uncharacterized protein PV09_01525 [Verruconis gallopava]|uniref:5'-3' exoribonuclease n=1 Tax=Verruconis gallopava TaxID=253628 RepID=A0A0D2B8L0_9PEZI|nr:uncharacterized protein PV09_01525 [Verruconis gallopava]KIW07569.1 hypothetical protein PV09_01525 [Verruconis gallopava]
MGVPAFFRWLSAKYPKIIAPVVEELPTTVDGVEIPADTTRPNPNGEEFDNLYLDMNGIVHPCSHPEDREPPKNEEEMMAAVFEYTNRVVNMVRPRKLLYMAVDGVAPRAKMNQQRARRFRAAQEKQEADEKKEEFRQLMLGSQRAEATDGEETDEPKKTWDSNVITPGTPFMRLLAQSLRYWVAYKLNTDPMWANLKVIISDATVPGEGEHKIMEFIRSQRRSQEFDPNTRHVIYGLDADLIMLALSTHEPHFRVLREDVFFQGGQQRPCKICGQNGHREQHCRGEAKKKDGEVDEKARAPVLKPFLWLKVNVLREYLAEELTVPHQPFRFDLERAIDDWVALCFFVGNDFLPHLPSLAIREEGIDILVAAWRDNLPLMGGYMTKDGTVELSRLQLILQALAKQEDAIFKKRKQIEDKREANAKRRKLQEEQRNANGSNDSTPTNQHRVRRGVQEDHSSYPTFDPAGAGWSVRQITHDMMVNKKASFQAQIADTATANKSAAAVLKERLKRTASQASLSSTNGEQDKDSQDNTDNGSVIGSPTVLGKRKADVLDESEGTPGRSTPLAPSTPKGLIENPPPDTVRLWEEGYQDRYYEQKFKVDPRDLEFRRKVANAYVEGVCWVLLYYMQGCASWGWYYPYHYAPFAQDFVDIANLNIKFEKGTPFRPYEQLMSVLPAASRHAIPELFHPLMTEEDSPIYDFYPTDFELDLNGKKFAHQGVVLLPFIDEQRLLKHMHELYPQLTEDEKVRNDVGKEHLYFSTKHPMYKELALNWYTKKQGAAKINLKPRTSLGLLGKVEKDENYIPDSGLYFPLSSASMPNLEVDNSMSVIYEMPKSTHIHKSMLLRGVILPPAELTREDLQTVHNKAGMTGRNFGGAPLRDSSGGRINYANPISQHLNPNFDPSQFTRAPPPPHIAAQMGFVPPPPPNWTGPPVGGHGGNPYSSRSYQNNQGYQGGQNYNSGYRGGSNQGYDGYWGNGNQAYDNRYQNQYPPPPIPPQQGYNGYGMGNRDRRDGYNDGYRGARGGRGGPPRY